MVGRWSPSLLLVSTLASIAAALPYEQSSDMSAANLFLKLRQNNNDNSTSASGPGSSNGSTPVSYNQPYRPQIHFSPSSGFMNDPNGLVVSGKPGNETIHMYYQYNPNDTVAGNQHWGHATSKSFESYEWKNHLPAIAPEAEGEGIFSGSAVIDSNNTSGFFDNSTEPEDRIVAIYTLNTADEESQNIAYSTNGGYNFTKYENNPVLRDVGKYQKQFRDPKVFWDAPHEQWVMAVAHTQTYEVGFYTSKDLKSWEEASRFSAGVLGYQYECPALFQAPYVGGDKDGQKGWVLLISINPGAPLGGSMTEYVIGDWDGKTFTSDDPSAKLADFGKDWYAAQTWDNTDPSKPPVVIGWASNWQYTNVVPTSPWRSVFSVPREVTLQYAALNPLDSRYVMAQNPINTSEIVTDSLHDGKTAAKNSTSVDLKGDGAFDITANITMSAATYGSLAANSTVDLYVNGTAKGDVLRIGFVGGEPGVVLIDRRFAGKDWADNDPFFTDRFSTQAQILYADDNDKENSDRYFTMRMIVDRTITELFVNDGIASAAVLHYWDQEGKPTSLEMKVGDDRLKVHLDVQALKSTW